MQNELWSFQPAANPTINGDLKPELKRAVFLDRDGTIIEDRDYLKRVEDVVIIPGAAAALKQLQDAGFLLFIVSNQSGVGRGYFTLEDVENVNAHIAAELAKSGVRFEKVYFAPEAPEQASRGRKPSPQFLFDARDEFGVELSRSFMIGDKLIDLECGWNAGVAKSLLVRTGYGARVEKASPEKLGPAVAVDDLVAAAKWILGNQEDASVHKHNWEFFDNFPDHEIYECSICKRKKYVNLKTGIETEE